MALPHNDVGWSTVCCCGISWSYSLSFFPSNFHFQVLFKLVETLGPFITPGSGQSKRLSTINERGSKMDINSVFDCHLSPVGRQMAIKTVFLTILDLRSSTLLAF